MFMDWNAQNDSDTAVLNRIDRSPLDASLVEGDEQLASLVEQHNTDLAELEARIRQLTDDRAAMVHAEDLFVCNSGAVRAVHRRLVDESWDVLVTLRKLLDQREALLRQMEEHVTTRWNDLREQRDEAFAKAEKALAREHRSYVKAEPLRGQAYVEELATNDEAVTALNQRIAELDAVDDRLYALRHKAQLADSALTRRQREVLAHLVI